MVQKHGDTRADVLTNGGSRSLDRLADGVHRWRKKMDGRTDRDGRIERGRERGREWMIGQGGEDLE